MLVIGSGGREHALVWKLAQDSRISKLYALPGNGGTIQLAESVNAPVHDIERLHQAILTVRADLVVVGPEVSLAAGIADRLEEDNIPCFGPSARAARIETSKVFAKLLMAKHGVPTADFEIFDSFDKLVRFVQKTPFGDGWVVKADGLAAGKGAFVCSKVEEVFQHARELLVENVFGVAGQRVVLERRLTGREASVLYWCDGEHFAPLPIAQDYKRAHDGDHGPNTGGMGSHCPAPHVTPELQKRVSDEFIRPVISALANDSTPFRGVLYAGLMLTDSGPKVIEFNCRFGDPETQVIVPGWNGSIFDTMFACIKGTLGDMNVSHESYRCAVCIVLAAEGYPGSYKRQIRLRMVPNGAHHVTFHAGTKHMDGQFVSSGGRVLNAVGFGTDLVSARTHAYELADELSVPGLFFRKDIAQT